MTARILRRPGHAHPHTRAPSVRQAFAANHRRHVRTTALRPSLQSFCFRSTQRTTCLRLFQAAAAEWAKPKEIRRGTRRCTAGARGRPLRRVKQLSRTGDCANARGVYRPPSNRSSRHPKILDENSVFRRNMRYFSRPDYDVVIKVFHRAADLREIADPQKSYRTRVNFNILRLPVRFPASKYAILTGEIRYSAHRRKVANLLHNFRASIGPKSKNRISNVLRQIKYKVVNLAPGKPWL